MSDDPRQQGTEDDPPIRVTDRRKFDREGRLRDDAPDEEASERPAPAASGAGSGPAQVRAGTDDDDGTRSDLGHTADRAGGMERNVDFQQFVYFIYMSALHELGVPTEPGAQPGPSDPQRARFFVEILDLLAEKTAGNLSPAEQGHLEKIYRGLRIQYLYVAAMHALGAGSKEGALHKPDLTGAKGHIDELVRMKDDLSGRVSDEERAALEEYVFQLQSQYVAASSGASS